MPPHFSFAVFIALFMLLLLETMRSSQMAIQLPAYLLKSLFKKNLNSFSIKNPQNNALNLLNTFQWKAIQGKKPHRKPAPPNRLKAKKALNNSPPFGPHKSKNKREKAFFHPLISRSGKFRW
ncbi:MAG: hypothetical protein AABW85_05065 [archaeon]